MKELTPTEKDVLYCAALGDSEGDTAEELGMSRSSVKGHRKSYIIKLDARNTTHAVVKAIALGILKPEEMVEA